MINDASIRSSALDPARSFIIQAPAGSGKTELLIQRYLVLLAHVEKKPEQIVAITFTKKAAAEMRHRIIHWLTFAQKNQSPTESHQKKTWQLAKAVLERDKKEAWCLIDNPNRLTIKTIDALASSLVASMPMTSKFGMNVSVTTHFYSLYEQASSAVLKDMTHANLAWSGAVERLLLELDNNYDRLNALFCNLLANRDQWIAYGLLNTNHEQLFKVLQSSVRSVYKHELSNFKAMLELYCPDNFFEILNFMCFQLDSMSSDSAIIHCSDYKSLPNVDVNNYKFWQGIFELLFTKTGTVRKTVTIKQGLPALSALKTLEEKELVKAYKATLKELLASLASDTKMTQSISTLMFVPFFLSEETNKCVLSDIFVLLPVLLAHLYCVFKQYNAVDFIEVMQAAKQSLGTDDNPTELALIMDNQLQHLLIDEFQDTSLVQWQLIEQLIAGWEPDGTRTVFLVGDPMQSIYAFRQADVGLFIRAQEHGIGPLRLESLTLRSNFRSTELIVNWCNHTLSDVFPCYNKVNDSAIEYKSSTAVNDSQDSDIQLYYTHPEQHVASIVQQIKIVISRYPQQSIGVLVRSRTHLMDLCAQLEDVGIEFDSVELQPLNKQLFIRDLISLLKLLLNPTDKFAWCCVLRAPWCGLTLKDLHSIINESKSFIWDCLINTHWDKKLSDDGQSRLMRFIEQFKSVQQYQDRVSVVHLLRYAWHQLQGVKYLVQTSDKEQVEHFFSYCKELEASEQLFNSSTIDRAFEKLFAANVVANKPCVSVMTIHKAKGLEFDTVILPGINARTPYDQQQLINWCGLSYSNNYYLLLSALEKEGSKSPVLNFIKAKNKTRKQFELSRLMYVALTRAKKRLYLFTNKTDTSNIGTFYQLLKNIYEKQGVDYHPLTVNHSQDSTEKVNYLIRYVDDKTAYVPTSAISQTKKNNNSNQAIDYHWQYEKANIIGTVFHHIINLYTRFKSKQSLWQSHAGYWRQLLTQYGMIGSDLDYGVKILQQCVYNCLHDKQGRWILDAHQASESEVEYSAVSGSGIVNYRLDRTFIEYDTRWIIDYKVVPRVFKIKQEHDAFLQQQKTLYLKQMQQYGQLFDTEGGSAIQLGLYFPYSASWVTWAYTQNELFMIHECPE